MPVTKVPVVHKFGIISHTQRLELQERLLKQTFLKNVESKKPGTSSRSPLEVTEEFVQKFNNAKTLNEKEKYEEVARKILERSKRRAGVLNSGKGGHVNLPLAWTELAQLAQCKGKIQEECLDVLITSLDVSPIEKYHVPALFFLSETMLYWLRTDAVHQPYLRTGEIKLLKLGQLVFTRLFYHHMAGQLQGQAEFKNRLFTYLDGLSECQEAYSPYPNALLSLRFVIEVGKIIMADSLIEPAEVKENDASKSSNSIKNSQESVEKKKEDTNVSVHSHAISSSVHDLSPTLWHALDVWRCTNNLGGGLHEALKSLAHCGLGLATENWIDGIIALHILCEAAKTDLNTMGILHRLATGVQTGASPQLSSRTDTTFDEIYENTLGSKTDLQEFESTKQSLSDISESNEEVQTSHRMDNKPTGGTTKRESKPKSVQIDKSAYSETILSEDILSHKFKNEKITTAPAAKGDKSVKETTGASHGRDVPGLEGLQDLKLGEPTGRDSGASSAPTFTNMPMPDAPGIDGWHWEVAITYIDILSDICLHAKNVNIQKMALMGINKDITTAPLRRHYTKAPLRSVGLLDLAFFHAPGESNDGGPNDWSWRIRYSALQSLVKVCRTIGEDKSRDGIRTAAWNTLIRANSVEKDERVMEALKVGQVHTDMESLLRKEVKDYPTAIGAKIAEGLSKIYLPPLPPPVEPISTAKSKSTPRRKPVTMSKVPSDESRKPMRTSLREEIMLATTLYEPPADYNTRMSFDMRRIVEDQWRKELERELEAEEEERQKRMKEQQEQGEELQKQKAENKKMKFQKNLKHEKIVE